ncbi:MAG: ABC transporter permease [Chloroflexi bacterium]|nr:ABC transporter permease [Chloroflexota bacterium]
MGAYYIRRLFFIIPTLFASALITFVIMHATPGGPFDAGNDKITERAKARLMAAYGLDKPLFFNTQAVQDAYAENKPFYEVGAAFFDAQFELWLVNFVQGKFGPSFRFIGRDVEDILLEPTSLDGVFWQNRLMATIILGLVATIIAVIVGFPLGVIAAVKQNSWVDNLCLFFATFFYGIPNIVLGIFLIIIFASWLGWVNVVEMNYWEGWRPWVLPAFVLAIPTAAFLARLTRSSVLEVLRMDFVRTARAKGLSENVVIAKHVVRNALIPVVTFLGPALATLITGSFVIETQFGVTGIGRLFVESVGRRDYSVIMALTLIYAFFIAIANLGVDLAYGFLDPRIRFSKK